MIKITLPLSAYDTFKEDIRESVDRGFFINIQGDTFTQETDGLFLTLEDVSAILSAGGEVEGLPIYIEMTAAKYASDVPAGIPNRSITDEEGVETVLKWSEWKGSNMTHAQYGTKHYVPANSNIAGGEYMKGSEFMVLNGVSGYKLLTEAEYKAVQIANAVGDGV